MSRFRCRRTTRTFATSLGLDSVDLVGLVMRIEREFHVRLSPEELATVKRVGDLLDLMETKLADRPDAFSKVPEGPVPSNTEWRDDSLPNGMDFVRRLNAPPTRHRTRRSPRRR